VPTAENNIVPFWYIVVPKAEHIVIQFKYIVVPMTDADILLCPQLNTILSQHFLHFQIFPLTHHHVKTLVCSLCKFKMRQLS
jgi:hypothetical protein